MMEQPSRSKLPEDRPRRCTDCLFLLAFLGALGAAGYAAVYASKNGDLARVLYGQDYMARSARTRFPHARVRSPNGFSHGAGARPTG